MPRIRKLDPGASPLDYFGSELRRLRERAKLSQDKLGAITYCTGSLVGQIETAVKCPTREFTERVEVPLGAEGALLRVLPLVLRSELPKWFQPIAELEAAAREIHAYQPSVVYGLLQTPDYARAVLGAVHDDDVDTHVAARMERQRILQREEPPLVWVILYEAVLRLPIGGAQVMRNQLAHLLGFQGNDRVRVQVLPFAAGAHAGLPGSFTALSFDDQPDMVYTEGYWRGQLTANPETVKELSFRYDLLQAAALSVKESAEMIARVMEECYGEQT